MRIIEIKFSTSLYSIRINPSTSKWKYIVEFDPKLYRNIMKDGKSLPLKLPPERPIVKLDSSPFLK